MQQSRMVHVFGALVALAILVAPAHAEERVPRVAIATALSVNASPDEVSAVTRAMAAALSARFAVEIFAGAEVARRLPAGGVPEDCAAQGACIEDLARRLSADQLLLLVVVRVGDSTQIDPTWIDVSSGRSASRPAIALAPGDDLAEVMEAAAPQLLPGAPERATAPPPPTVRLDVTTRMRPQPRHMTPAAWIVAGVSSAALLGSAGFGLSARGRYHDCQDRPCSDDALSTLETRALVADVLLGFALAGGATAGILYWRSGSEAPAIDVAPADGGAVVRMGGRF